MPSLTGCLNSHLLCIGSEKKLQKNSSSCEHELTILMSHGGCLMLPSLCLLQTEFLCLVQKFISALECCSLIWGSVKQWGQGSCFTSEDMGCFNWGLTPLRTSQRSQQEFVTQSRGCPCCPLPCPSALLGSSCQVPHSSHARSAPKQSRMETMEAHLAGVRGSPSYPSMVSIPALLSHCLAGAALTLPACLYPCCRQE